jgi:type IV secretion system protein VirD4
MLLELSIAAALVSGYRILTKDKFKPSKAKLKNYKELKDFMGEGVRLSENVRLSQHFSNEHVLVCAPSGMRKTRGIIMPSVNEIQDATLIVTDPFCEIEKECKKDNAIVFNPYSNKSIGYNPLANCRTVTEVKKVAQTIMANSIIADPNKAMSGDDQEWQNKAEALLSAYMIWNWKTKKYSFDEFIVRLVSARMQDIHEEIMESDVIEAQIEFMSFAQIAGSPVTLSCIRNRLNTGVKLFLDPAVQNLFDKPSIQFDKLRNKPTTLYIQIPEKDSEYFTPLTATFVSQMLDRLVENDKGIQTYLLFDELCNIGYIPSFTKLLSTCRKRNISISGCIQSLSQLERVYGNTQAQELRELFKTLVVMGGLKDSADYVSGLLGNEEVVKDKQRYIRPVMSADQVRRMPIDKCLILCHNKQPVVDDIFIM